MAICGKIFERFIYKFLCSYLTKYNYLLSSDQSGFKTGGFCVNKLLSITIEIHTLFKDYFEVPEEYLRNS